MGKKRFEASVKQPGEALRAYDAPWQGQLVLVCEKCERRLRKDREHRDTPRLRKVLKACAEESSQPIALRVLEVGCMKLCPEGGVTVCTGEQAAENPVQLSVIRTPEDVVLLYGELVRMAAEAAATAAGAALMMSSRENTLPAPDSV